MDERFQVGKISRQHIIWVVAWLLLIAFIQVYMKKEHKPEQKEVESVQFGKESSVFHWGTKQL